MIELHYHPRSTFSRRVHMLLLEKSVPFELVPLDMEAKAHKSPAYLALNPYGRVPTIEHDGFVLYESTAIMEYLEAVFPTPPLLPTDLHDRALVSMHVKLADVELGSVTSSLIFPLRFLPKERWDEAAMDRARKQVSRHLAIVETQLGDREWMVGGRFSHVELAYASFMEFFPRLGVEIPPRVAAWTARTLARPSAVATKPDV